MCKTLPCPLHGQTCRYCLNSAEGETEEMVTAAGAVTVTVTVTACRAY